MRIRPPEEDTEMKIAIAGKETETANYATFLRSMNITPAVTLNMEEIDHPGLLRGKQPGIPQYRHAPGHPAAPGF